MAWVSRGLRGSTLEELVNRTNEQYAEKKLALIQKIPTPITPVRMDKDHHQITLAYFEQRSTVDYIGAVQGIPVCFDAKECSTDTFPLSNIHSHQVAFMKAFNFLGANGKGRQKKLPQRGTGTAVLPSETERIFCSLSGGTENGSEFTGLTSGFAFIIILLFNIVSQ